MEFIMAIDILIKQKLFGKKTMPLEVILGEHLHYGSFVNDQLYAGELGETEFVAYNPDSIGRGFSVIWNPNEKKKIALRLPIPSTPQELKDFYAAVERMVKYWDGILIVDGIRSSLPKYLSTYDNTVEFNYNAIKQFSVQILLEENELTLYSTMWPLTVGKEEASLFMGNPDQYAEWLHKKQSIDAYFSSPRFFADDNGEIFARYILTDNTPTILPYRPTVPFGAIDPQTGNQLECKKWMITLFVESKEEPIGEMEYSKFLDIIPESEKNYYDSNHFLLSQLTEEEIYDLSIK